MNKTRVALFLSVPIALMLACKPDGEDVANEIAVVNRRDLDKRGQHEELIVGLSRESPEIRAVWHDWLQQDLLLAKGDYTVPELALFLSKTEDVVPSIVLNGDWDGRWVKFPEDAVRKRTAILTAMRNQCEGEFVLTEDGFIVFGPRAKGVTN